MNGSLYSYHQMTGSVRVWYASRIRERQPYVCMVRVFSKKMSVSQIRVEICPKYIAPKHAIKRCTIIRRVARDYSIPARAFAVQFHQERCLRIYGTTRRRHGHRHTMDLVTAACTAAHMERSAGYSAADKWPCIAISNSGDI